MNMEERLRPGPECELGCELVADVARRFGEVRLRLTGASMMPAVRPGDVITAQRCRTAELKPGEIVLYRRGTGLVAHRVVRIDGGRLVTQGDSLPHEDTPVKEADVMGRVVLVTRSGRRVDARLTLPRRALSGILRRSGICLRAAMFLARGMRRLERPDGQDRESPDREENREMAWA